MMLLLFNGSYGVAIIQWITSCNKYDMNIHCITFLHRNLKFKDKVCDNSAIYFRSNVHIEGYKVSF